jgi:single-strand DNA-binding protein
MENVTEGTIKVIMDLQTFDSGFIKREFVITTKEEYPQDIKFEITKEKAETFETYNKVGDEVTVKFNIRGNFHDPTNRYFVNLQAWRIEKNSSQNTEEETVQIEEESDLPF